MNTQIRDEEYPFLAFGVSWLIDRVLSGWVGVAPTRPRCVWIDERPQLNSAECDLIFDWHKRYLDYGDEIVPARYDLLCRSKEDALFTREEFQKYGGIDVNSTPDEPRAWKFVLSRVGLHVKSRLALAHFFVTADGDWWHTCGYTLKFGWGDDDVITLIRAYSTAGPAK